MELNLYKYVSSQIFPLPTDGIHWVSSCLLVQKMVTVFVIKPIKTCLLSKK